MKTITAPSPPRWLDEPQRQLRMPVLGQQRRQEQRPLIVVRQGLPENRVDVRK